MLGNGPHGYSVERPRAAVHRRLRFPSFEHERARQALKNREIAVPTTLRLDPRLLLHVQ